MSPECVTPSDREKTKRVVYSVVYGMGMGLGMGHRNVLVYIGKDKLSEILKTTPSKAQDLIANFLGIDKKLLVTC